MADSKRQNRLSEEIRKLVSNMIFSELNISELKYATITSVKISPDLYYANIFYNVMESGPVKRGEIERLFTINRKKIRQFLSQKLRIKQAPEIKFIYDDTLDKVYHIEKLLEGIKKDEPSVPDNNEEV
ncbi:MAG: 30S ribosome-binding factor RbfA [Candidatus Delongbacteria bacterium]|nr:30S ribosome-binding factor RbfA [Candidatus Delongbacteria bacterium]MBN2835669.1 30S ribosome-binding factor RbfA [Candidatus Delongbacteria bacterium]